MVDAYTLVTPSSVVANGGGSSASIAASGKITFSTCVSLNINGCFTSTYDTYYATIRVIGTTDATIRLRMRAAGSDVSTGTYDFQGNDIDNNGAAFRSTNQTEARWGGAATSPMGGEMWITSPALAVPTAGRTRTIVNLSTTSYLLWYFWQQRDSTAFDGMTLYPNTGTMTGSLMIYGLTK